jgi:hypothetical protein
MYRNEFHKNTMSLNQLLPTVNQLSHQDKLRLVHFLLLAIAKEEGCNLDSSDNRDTEQVLLNQLALSEAVVWSPQADSQAVQALSDLLVATQNASND